MGAFVGGQLDAGDAEDVLEAVHLHRPMDGVVIRHRNSNPQLQGTVRDLFNRVVSVRQMAVEVQIHDRKPLRQFLQVGSFKQDPVSGVVSHHAMCPVCINI